MANIISKRTIGNILFLQIDSDPILTGAVAPIGSLAIIFGVNSMWQKIGEADTAWGIILAGTDTPLTISDTNAEGSATTAARSDHIHSHGDQLGGSLHALATTTSNGFMSANDKTRLDNIKSSKVLADAFIGSPKKYQVVFTSAMPSVNYTITITSADARVWTFENKTIDGFTINSNSNQLLVGEVHWQVVEEFL